MKIRLGFVSNSSSEAFICVTNKDPKVISQELRDLLAVYNRMTGQSYRFSGVFKEPDKSENIPLGVIQAYVSDHKQNPPLFTNLKDDWNDLRGKIIIESAEDNSIPYALFEIIEEAYNATRLHLG